MTLKRRHHNTEHPPRQMFRRYRATLSLPVAV